MSKTEGPPTRVRQDAGANAWIVEERDAPGSPRLWFVAVAIAIGLAVAALAIVWGAQRGDPLPAEAAHADSGTPFGLAAQVLGLEVLRGASGAIAGATATGAAFAARRLSHSDAGGLLAGLLIALDPAVLLEGQLAVPVGFLRFAAVASLALAMGGRPAWRWLVPVPMAAGAAIDPLFLLWGIPLVALLALRGNIYAAPKHLALALGQALLIPASIGAAFHAVAHGIGTVANEVCATPTRWDALWLQQAPAYGEFAVAVPNLVGWFAGLALLLALVAGALWSVGSRFRLTRSPGRLQIRLPGPLGRLGGRALWLLAFAVFAPHPAVWLLVGVMALALGIHHLDKDSRGFAAAVSGAAVVFAVLYLIRFAGAVGPEADAADLDALLRLVPWVDPVACPS